MALLLPYPPGAIKGQQGLLYTIVHKKSAAQATQHCRSQNLDWQSQPRALRKIQKSGATRA